MGNIFRRVLLVLTASGKVTDLLFIITASDIVQAGNVKPIDLSLFEFTSEFYMPMGRGRIDGLMASDGSRNRIAIYWIEPAVYHDSTFFLGYSDFIFEEDVVHYWIHGATQPGTINLFDKESEPLLLRDVSVKSVARSALAIANRIRLEHEQEDIPLELGRFFRRSRDRTDYSYEVPSDQSTRNEASASITSDVQILNALPYGRKYSKETQSDGAIIWRAQRVLDGPNVARVTVKPVSGTENNNDGSMFDPDTSGQWALVPEPYRAYWSFDRAYSELKDAPDNDVPSRELHDEIETYLDNNKVPDKVCLAFNQLLFKTALLIGDTHRVSLFAYAL